MILNKEFFNEPDLLASFLRTQEEVFPWLNMKWALDNGVMPPKTTPFGLFDGRDAVSIMTATEQVIVADGMRIPAVQFGTVATLSDHRNRGYSRQLVNYALSHYAACTDLVFLYANDEVIDFYPKFGFKPVKEQPVTCELTQSNRVSRFRKLEFENGNDLAILEDLIQNRDLLSESFCVQDYNHLARWYCIGVSNVE
ncbi:MAG: GNAT family N-acetyltransferase [Proteobacteria bacterium]|nr:GNAT family N-acetyltransferase [Pseudomonadota bacterium]